MVEVKERLENGIDVLSISNSHLTVEVTNFGCTLLKIVTKDKNDQDCDCILGFEHVEDYQKRDGTYLNALVGRVCNRIEKGTFTMNEVVAAQVCHFTNTFKSAAIDNKNFVIGFNIGATEPLFDIG